MTRSSFRLLRLGLVGALLVPSLEAQTVALTGAANTTSLRWGKIPGVIQFQVTRRQRTPDPTGRFVTTPYALLNAVTGFGYNDVLLTPSVFYDYVDLLAAPGAYVYVVAATAIGLRGVVAWLPALGATGYQVWRRFVDLSGKTTMPVQVGTVPNGQTTWLDGLPDPRSSVEYQIVSLSPDGRAWPSSWTRGR